MEATFSKKEPIRILRRRQLEARLAIGRSTIYDWLRSDPTFPRPVKIGCRAVGWVESEINDWLARRMAARG
jgi:prophage regulatory protein